jgi:hypothetical protein
MVLTLYQRCTAPNTHTAWIQLGKEVPSLDHALKCKALRKYGDLGLIQQIPNHQWYAGYVGA